jgi:hypothetical protein
MITFGKYELILESLMDNIIKAIPRGGITVTNLASKIGKKTEFYWKLFKKSY